MYYAVFLNLSDFKMYGRQFPESSSQLVAVNTF